MRDCLDEHVTSMRACCPGLIHVSLRFESHVFIAFDVRGIGGRWSAIGDKSGLDKEVEDLESEFDGNEVDDDLLEAHVVPFCQAK